MTTDCINDFDMTTPARSSRQASQPALSWEEIGAIIVTGLGFVLLLPAATIVVALLR